jgi:hypothetical protein
MDQQIKAEWVAALRSGEYEQGVQLLRQGDQFCCLGVLCDLHRKAHQKEGENDTVNSWFPTIDPEMDNAPCFSYRYGNTTSLPDVVIDWCGLYSCDPPVQRIVCPQDYDVTEDGTLSSFNDKGLTFDQIADIIEEQL